MRTRIFSLALLVMLSAFTCTANAYDKRDGNWWNQLPQLQELMYTIGFMDGHGYEQMMFTRALIEGTLDPKSGKYDPTRGATAKDAGRYANNQAKRDFAGVTAGQLVTGLDKVYTDYRNMRIDVSDAMIAVLRNIGGMSDDELGKFIQKKRKAAGKYH